MLDNLNEAHIDGNGNIVIQNAAGAEITINPNNQEEVKAFLVEINKNISELPLEIIKLLESKSKEEKGLNEMGANLYLDVQVEYRIGISVNVNWLTTITNLTKEIRYFNQPYFKVSPKLSFDNGLDHDTFIILQKEDKFVNFPYRLEYGQTVDSIYPINVELMKLYEQLNIPEGFIQAFTSTTVGEIYSSIQYPISKLFKKYEELQKLV